MELFKVIIFNLCVCILFIINFAVCNIPDSSVKWYDRYFNSKRNRSDWNEVYAPSARQWELTKSDWRGNYSYTLEELGIDRTQDISNLTDKYCVIPKEDHRVIYLLRFGKTHRIVWGTIVNFTDPISGRRIEVDEYLAIPYAIPPHQNNERFQPARFANDWYGPAHRHRMPKGCIQPTSSRVPWALQGDDKENLSEDCLYMNVWSPFNQSGLANQSSLNEKPVLVWIHGGFFLTGSAGQEIYNGRVLAGLGDIVVVTVNYRLGAFGFWSSDRESAPGNIALIDLYKAIDFIGAFIAYFGGDPSRMTIAGQGAGAVAAGLLSLGHRFPRNWRRLILQSGSLINPFPSDPEETLIHSYNLAIGVGCANESYLPQEHPEEVETCMRSVDPFVLAEEESKMRLRPGPYTTFLPTWGTPDFPYHPYRDLLEGNHPIQEMIIGTNRYDGAFQIAASDPDRFGYFFEKESTIDPSETKRIFARMFPYVNSSDVDEVFQIYSTSEEFSNVENETWIPILQLVRAVTDLSFACPSLFFAEKMMAKKVKVYFYDFKFKPIYDHSPWPQWMRPVHFEEVQYIFGKPFLEPEEYDVEEIELSRHLIQTWANFTSMLTTWPRFDYVTQPLNDSFMENPDVQVTDQMPQLEQCNVFRKYFGRSLL